MRILILSYHFPPYNQIGAVRLGKMAKYLRAFGHEVRVVTADDYLRKSDLALEIPAEEVLYTSWLDINKPGRIFYRQKGTDVIQTIGAPPNPFIGKLRGIYETVLNFPDDRVGWLPYVLKAGSRLIKTWRPDVIYASGGPFIALVAASILARKHSVPWVGELRDLWSDNHFYRFPRWRKRLDSWLERRILSSARGIVTVTEPWATFLKEKYGKPTVCVPNGFDPSDFEMRAEQHQGEVLRLVYSGAFYPGGQNPSSLFAALGLLGPLRNFIQIQFYGTDPELLRQMAIENGVESQVEFFGSIPYLESLSRQVNADILLLFLWKQPKGPYPGKLFEYLGARRPILGIGANDDIAAELIVERGAGEIAGCPEDIVRLLEKWIRQKQSGGIPSLAESVSLGLSREERTGDISRFLEEIIPKEDGIESTVSTSRIHCQQKDAP